jgi:hypothetical protein
VSRKRSIERTAQRNADKTNRVQQDDDRNTRGHRKETKKEVVRGKREIGKYNDD